MCSETPDPDDGFYHAVVERDDGMLYDASGVVTTEELMKRYKRRECFLCYPQQHHYYHTDMGAAINDAAQQLQKVGLY